MSQSTHEGQREELAGINILHLSPARKIFPFEKSYLQAEEVKQTGT